MGEGEGYYVFVNRRVLKSEAVIQDELIVDQVHFVDDVVGVIVRIAHGSFTYDECFQR